MKKVFFTLMMVIMAAATQAQGNPGQYLRHVVLFKFKDASSASDVKKIETSLRGLKEKIKGIKALEWGLNNSPEKKNEGFTHCFFLSFSSEADRDAYLVHPDHKAFVDLVGPHVDKVLVFDYWAGK